MGRTPEAPEWIVGSTQIEDPAPGSPANGRHDGNLHDAMHTITEQSGLPPLPCRSSAPELGARPTPCIRATAGLAFRRRCHGDSRSRVARKCPSLGRDEWRAHDRRPNDQRLSWSVAGLVIRGCASMALIRSSASCRKQKIMRARPGLGGERAKNPR